MVGVEVVGDDAKVLALIILVADCYAAAEAVQGPGHFCPVITVPGREVLLY